jgi:Family of unknown function (DUF5990)
VRLRIEGFDLPGSSCGPSPERPGGHHHIHVGVQRRGRPDELLGLTSANAASASWVLDCAVTSTETGYDVTGPYVSGPPGGRFVYLSWGTVDGDTAFTMFRRAKLWLDPIPPDVIDTARADGELVGRLGLTDPKGNPLCASVRPPQIEWSAVASGG